MRDPKSPSLHMVQIPFPIPCGSSVEAAWCVFRHNGELFSVGPSIVNKEAERCLLVNLMCKSMENGATREDLIALIDGLDEIQRMRVSVKDN